MERIEKAVEVNCPVRAVYNQWTQFEDFPRFMKGVKEVRQLDDTHLHWHAEIWGKDEEWDAEITEQIPDQRICWRSTSGAPNGGEVRFEPLGADRTRVCLSLSYEPQGVVEKAGDAMGVFGRRVESDVKEFKKFIEKRGAETGNWRGEVHGAQPTGHRSMNDEILGAAGSTGSMGGTPDTHTGLGSESAAGRAGYPTGGGAGPASTGRNRRPS